MKNAPNSFKDPYWSNLAKGVEVKLALPKGLLAAVVTRGERSNADQVSEAGAKTPFQIIPATAKAALEKWGIDPYLSPENAAEVAGLLLKESLQRNQGDPALAVAEYHGGTDRANWGPKTKAYVQRVVGAQPGAVADPALSAAVPIPPADGPSTFDRLTADQKAASSAAAANSIANIYAAYQAGKMSPEEAQQFEADVKAGKMLLPRGAKLNDAAPAETGAPVLPMGVLDAYASGKMSPEERSQLESDLKAGLVKLPAGAVLGNSAAVARIPGADGAATAPDQPMAGEEPSVGAKLLGTGEAALNALTGMTTGGAGMLLGGGKQIAADLLGLATQGGAYKPEQGVEQAALSGAQALTYAPRTPSGQDQAQAVGEVLQQALPVMPLTGEVAALGRAMQPLATAAGTTARAAPAAVADAAGAAREALIRAAKPGAETPPAATPGTLGSVGAAATDMARQRREIAASLPEPIKLTKGQAERDPAQLTFEAETAKDPALGAPLRENAAEQNARLQRNFEAFIDDTGAQAPNLIETGRSVDQALVKDAARAKAEYRTKYKAAEKAGAMEDPVSMAGVVQHLNDAAPEATTAPLLTTARSLALKLGLAEEGEGGALVPRDVSLKTAEQFRQAINRNTGIEPTNIRQASIMKGLIDEATDGAGGQLYKEARKARQRYAQLYEDNAVVSDLLASRKGTADRKVALEHVFNRTILNGSREDLSMLRRTLQVSGSEEGAQAWKELQGATLRHLLDQATSGVGTDMRGNPIFSAAKLNNAVRALESGGKLDFILGKQGAQQIRDVNDLAKVIYTLPPGSSVNTSNTAATLMRALAEAGAWGSVTGLPVPVLTGLKELSRYAKDRKIAQRVAQALNDAQKRDQAAAKKTPKAPAKF